VDEVCVEIWLWADEPYLNAAPMET